MKPLFIILGFACMVLTCAVYEFNQTRRKDWVMDLAGVIGYLAFLAAPILLGIGFKTF